MAVALAAFFNMFAVGTVYALSTLQVELPRLLPLQVSQSLSLVPFAAACLGLSIGTRMSASLITNWGSHATMATGTVLWGAALVGTGYSLQQQQQLAAFQGILTSLVLGGVGVGFTYLAVIVTVGLGLPQQPLARSIIGPLGFSSGSAACVVLSSYFRFQSHSVLQLGQLLVLGGGASVVIALATLVVLPNNALIKPVPAQTTLRDSSETLFSILLFCNAFPGMAAFVTLLPAAAPYGSGENNLCALAGCMISLALGGLLAPSLSQRFGAKPTFTALFGMRGLFLTTLSRSSSSPSTALVALLVVLFAHGAGFSILPILLKSKYPDPIQFYTVYARILPAWGAAGIAAVAFNSFFLSFTGNIEPGYLYLGILAISISATLSMLPPNALGS
ncbi:hypothetical protein SBRCBS47491_002835 [Sporothrix bragantina]|uniref:Uncharacterized protein n=1 Tax=Sporothrix bragantina TaxID=671064 RepID=A0ABP0BAG6_9PEZI